MQKLVEKEEVEMAEMQTLVAEMQSKRMKVEMQSKAILMKVVAVVLQTTMHLVGMLIKIQQQAEQAAQQQAEQAAVVNRHRQKRHRIEIQANLRMT
jgi:hypothetical protein